MTFDWSAINTALMLGAIFYVYRQARMVDGIRAALLGVEGQGGALSEIKLLRERSHDLSSKLTVLTGTVEELTHVMEERNRRRGP